MMGTSLGREVGVGETPWRLNFWERENEWLGCVVSTQWGSVRPRKGASYAQVMLRRGVDQSPGRGTLTALLLEM